MSADLLLGYWVVDKQKHPRYTDPWKRCLSKVRPEQWEQLYDMIIAGNFRSVAAAAAGISPNSLKEWMFKGAMGQNEPYQKLFEFVITAEAIAEAETVKRMKNAYGIYEKGESIVWQAEAWLLQRRSFRNWGFKAAKDSQAERDREEELAKFRERVASLGKDLSEEHEEWSDDKDEERQRADHAPAEAKIS